MQKAVMALIMAATMMGATPLEAAPELTVFACSDQGGVNNSLRFNAGPPDTARDVFPSEVEDQAPPPRPLLFWLRVYVVSASGGRPTSMAFPYLSIGMWRSG